LRSTEKSSHRSVVRPRNHAYDLARKQNIKMKTKLNQSTPPRSLWQMFRRRARRHDPMLLLNMSLFNFTDGWSRVFSREQYGRFSA
jgi:hypothetical protein